MDTPISVSGLWGWSVAVAYCVLAGFASVRVFIDQPSRLAVLGHICIAAAWAMLAGRAMHGMLVYGEAIRALPVALGGLFLIGASSAAHIAHSILYAHPRK